MTASPHTGPVAGASAADVDILVTGANGQVGHALGTLDWGGARVHSLGRAELDLGDPEAAAREVARLRPAVVINAAAYTAVDRAESEPALAYRVNAEAPAAIARAVAGYGGLLVHYSTDYVFDGTASRPYREDDATAPSGVYGASKLAGEQGIADSGCDHLVLRTSWVYSYRGGNFLRTMLRLAAERDTLTVVADQAGTPTYAVDLARLTRDMLRALGTRRDPGVLGVYHLGNEGQTTWHGFAREILRGAGHQQVAVEPITTADYPTPARRPAYSVLDKGRAVRTFGLSIPTWQDGLARCLAHPDRVAA